MEEKHRKAIVKNVIELVKIQNFDDLLEHLIQFGIYTRDMIDLLLAKESPNPGQQAQKVFLDLPTRGPNAFDGLHKALIKTGNGDLGVKIMKDSSTDLGGDKNLNIKKSTITIQIPPIQEDEVDTSSNSSCVFGSLVSAIPPLKKFKLNNNAENEDPEEQKVLQKEGHKFNVGLSENSQETLPLVPESRELPEIELCVFGNEDSKFTVIPSKELYSGYTNLSECYRMKSNPRGLALVVNNIEFLGDPDAKRNGAQYDSVNLSNLLEQLGYQVTLAENVTKDKLLNHKTGILSGFIKTLQESDADSCIVSINSHGFNRDFIRMSDPPGRSDNSTAVDLVLDIIARFSNRNFPDFHGKPKVFLVNACRGSNLNRGVRKSFESERRRIEGDGTNNEDLPTFFGSEYSDIFIIRSTVPDYVSLRDLDRGTWFVECLCKAFAKYSHALHFSDLKCKVSTFIESMFDESNRKQSIHYEEFGSTKRLYFNPGL